MSSHIAHLRKLFVLLPSKYIPSRGASASRTCSGPSSSRSFSLIAIPWRSETSIIQNLFNIETREEWTTNVVCRVKSALWSLIEYSHRVRPIMEGNFFSLFKGLRVGKGEKAEKKQLQSRRLITLNESKGRKVNFYFCFFLLKKHRCNTWSQN